MLLFKKKKQQTFASITIWRNYESKQLCWCTNMMVITDGSKVPSDLLSCATCSVVTQLLSVWNVWCFLALLGNAVAALGIAGTLFRHPVDLWPLPAKQLCQRQFRKQNKQKSHLFGHKMLPINIYSKVNISKRHLYDTRNPSDIYNPWKVLS